MIPTATVKSPKPKWKKWPRGSVAAAAVVLAADDRAVVEDDRVAAEDVLVETVAAVATDHNDLASRT